MNAIAQADRIVTKNPRERRPLGMARPAVRGLRRSSSASSSRFDAIATVRAVTRHSRIRRSCPGLGQPLAARKVLSSAKGSAKTVWESLMSRAKVTKPAPAPAPSDETGAAGFGCGAGPARSLAWTAGVVITSVPSCRRPRRLSLWRPRGAPARLLLRAFGVLDRLLAVHAQVRRRVNAEAHLLADHLDQRHQHARADRERLAAAQLVNRLKRPAVFGPTEHSPAGQDANAFRIDIGRAYKDLVADQNP